MSQNRLLFPISLMMCLLLGCSAAKNNNANIIISLADQKYIIGVLEASVTGDGIEQIDNTFQAIKDSIDKSSQPDVVCMELIRYHLGAGPKEIILEYLIDRGSEVIPLLNKYISHPPACLHKYQSLCLEDDDVIDAYKDIIDSINDQ